MKVAMIAAAFSCLLAGLGHLYLTPALSRRRGPTVAVGLAAGGLIFFGPDLPNLFNKTPLKVVQNPDGEYATQIQKAVFENHKDAYYQECGMRW